MSGQQERPPLSIRPGSSRILETFLMTIHGAALWVVMALPVGWPWRLGLGVLVVASLPEGPGTQVLFAMPRVVREAVWQSDGAWTLTLISGEQVTARCCRPASWHRDS